MNDHNEVLGPSGTGTTAKLTAALGAAQLEFKTAGFDSKNDHFRSKYASFQSCCLAVREALVKHGMALPDYRTGVLPNGDWVMIGTLRHMSGEYISAMAPLYMGKKHMQEFGSACTYAKRTLLMALTGAFSGEPDDDGNGLGEHKDRAEPEPKPASKSMQVAEDMEKELAYEAAAKEAIVSAEDAEAAAKFLAKVKLRAKEKAITPGVYKRCEAEYKKKWEAEDAG
jgi:hypothetical protein